MKCTDGPFVASNAVLELMGRKPSVFRAESGTGNAVHLVLVCAPGLRGDARPEGVAAVVGLDDLFLA